MSNAEDLTACMGLIQSIPDDQAQEPNMPVDVFLQGAENLAHWATEDLVGLTVAGVDAMKIENLFVRAGAAREAESLRNKERRSLDNWNVQADAAYDLRDELLHAFRYAFRNDSSLLSRVNAIAEGNGHDDMVQDLNDLAVLGRESPLVLNKIGFALEKLDLAAALSDQMAGLLAMINGAKKEGNSAKLLRDQAYTYLKELVDEVRACGKYVFWKDKRRLKGYQSDYWRKKNSTKPIEPEVIESEAAE